MYLRKSRMDLEAESNGRGDTLQRHRACLLELAQSRGLPILKIYEEVVSGETITSRPQMQQLLHDVEEGRYGGVLVMEIERLARGDTIDQGIVARAFQFSRTQIITPAKSYDPSDEFDQEYFEFGLYMSRREYKTINRRQQAGRAASVREGKWPANRAPYGYSRMKLQTQKGWTLTPNQDAPVVQDIFRWYIQGVPEEDGTVQRLGVSKIARRLNERGLPSPGGKDWTPSAIVTILRNPAYAGWVRWGSRAQVKRIENGAVIRSRPRAKLADDPSHWFPGLHTALVSQETFDLAQSLLSANPSRPGPKGCVTANPLAGLVRCDQCGRLMVRRPYQTGYPASLICPYPACPTVSSRLETVEDAILQSMRLWLSAFAQTPLKQDPPSETEEARSLSRSIRETEQALGRLEQQEAKAYDLVEQGIYPPDVFETRMVELSARRTALLEAMDRLNTRFSALLNVCTQSKRELSPAFPRVLDAYREAQTAQQKNELLKSVLNHVSYHKSAGGRHQASDLTLKLFPRLRA